MSNNIYVEFNGDGNATLLRRFNKDGNCVSEQTSVYNDKGQLMETELVSSSKGLLEKTVYTYKGGRLYSMRVTDAEDSLKKYEVYRYFGDDSIKVDYSFKEDQPAGYRIMTYDERGYNTGNIMYSLKDKKSGEARTTVFRFERTLDSRGNWIERLTYQDGGTIPVKIEKREIKYAD